MKGPSVGRLTALVVVLVAGAWGQYNQRIPFEVCELAADTTRCAVLSGTTVYQVSGNVATLGDLFRLCMEADTVSSGSGPIRVILAIDASGSMCRTYGGVPPNDSTDQRIVAAHAFLDSLAVRSPESQLGVVEFGGNCDIVAVQPPLPVNSAANRRTLHLAIREASCYPTRDPYPLKTLAAALTCQGNALDTSYAVLMAAGSSGDLKNHVILLTDFGWEPGSAGGRTALMPSEVLSRFYTRYPDREIPVTHAVFLTYNAQVSTDTNLQVMTDTTGGMFIPNAAPSTIVQTFMNILGSILIPKAEALYVLTVTHVQTGLQQEAMISKLSGINDYLIRSVDMPLLYGMNTFIFSKVFQTVDGRTLSVDRDTLRVERMQGQVAAPGGMFSVTCGIDSTDIVIACSPTRVLTGVTVAVDARVQADKAQRFVPGEVTVRGLKRHETGQTGVVALYHLDGTLVDAYGTANGTGTVGYPGSGAAFGSCMGSGTFSATFSTPPAATYTLEAWVSPGLSSPAATIISGSGYRLSVNTAGRLEFQAGATLTSWGRLARGVWQHVAVVREGGQGRLYVNGVPASGTGAVGEVTLGTMTVGPPGSGRIDEVMVSTVSRVATAGGVPQLSLPLAAGVTWAMPQGPVAGNTAPLLSQQWQQPPAGAVNFSFAGSTPVDLVVNFLHTAGGAVWSANSNPVSIYSTINTVPVRAELFDTDGDGYLDQIVIVLPDTVTLVDSLPAVAALLGGIQLTLPDGSTVNLSAASLTRLNGTSFAINLNESRTGALQTGWQNAAITFTSQPVTTSGQPIQVTQVVDRAGPVVARAVYRPGAGGVDTLYVTFSEPVVWQGLGTTATPDAVFLYYQGADAATGAFSGLDAGDLGSSGIQTAYILMGNGFAVTPMQDSLGLRAGTVFVRDSAGNAPRDRRAAIEWTGTGQVVLIPGPWNPLVHDQPIPATVVNFYQDALGGASGSVPGVIVGIQATKPLQPTGTHPQTGKPTYGTAVVFDAVGNIVRDDLYVMKASSGYRDYGVYWNAQNSRGRKVGGGTYLMIVKMRDVDGKSLNERTKIGVKHKT